MEANLLYILEEELRPEFQRKLCMFSKTTNPLFIVVQLKSPPLDSQPMIQDLKKIRIEKAIKKIDNWINICFAKHQNLTIKVIEGLPQLSRPFLDFTNIKKLNVYRSNLKPDQVLRLVKGHFDSEHLNLQYFN